MNTEIRIALTNLGAYNEGTLRFAWVTLPASEEELEEAYEAIGIGKEDGYGGVYEEVFITDYEAPFEIGEYDDIEELNEKAEMLTTLDEWDLEIVEAYMECYNNDVFNAIDALNRCTWYPNMTLEEIAEELLTEDLNCAGVPDWVYGYIDFSSYANDLRHDNYYEVNDGVLYIG